MGSAGGGSRQQVSSISPSEGVSTPSSGCGPPCCNARNSPSVRMTRAVSSLRCSNADPRGRPPPPLLAARATCDVVVSRLVGPAENSHSPSSLARRDWPRAGSRDARRRLDARRGLLSAARDAHVRRPGGPARPPERRLDLDLHVERRPRRRRRVGRLGTHRVSPSVEPRGRGRGVLAAAATWSVQRRVAFPLVDEGGPLSLAKVSSTLGEPLKISTWREFYRSAGPPTAARCGALGVAFFAGGARAARSRDRWTRGGVATRGPRRGEDDETSPGV